MRFSFVAIAVFAFFAMAVADDSGTCGENLTWTYSENDETVVISGIGDMTNYTPDQLPPWKGKKYRVYHVIFQEGVTSIGDYAFVNVSVTDVSFPSTLKRIGASSFQRCGFESIDIPEGVESMGTYAFEHAFWMKHVSIPSTLTHIPDYAFSFCTSLEDLVIAEGVKTIGVSCFRGAPVKYLVLPSTITSIDTIGFGYIGSITSIIFLGEPTISCGTGVFQYSEAWYTCVKSSYITTNVCGQRVSSRNASAEAMEEIGNKCFRAACGGSIGLVPVQYENVSDWEKKSSVFVECYCDNETGLTHRSLCKSVENKTMMCYNDSCTEKEPLMGEGWAVEVDIEQGDIINISFSEIARVVSDRFDATIDESKVGIEMDNEGNTVGVILFVADKPDAETVKKDVEDLIESSSCPYFYYNIFCTAKAVRIIPDKNYHSESSDVPGSGASIRLSFLVMLLFIAFMFI